MKAQLQTSSRKSSKAAPADSRVERAITQTVRADRLELARRRIASGYYESDVCLDITIRRLLRELKRPAPVVVVTPGRAAEKRVRGPKGHTGRRG